MLATSAIFTSTTGTWAATGSLYQARVFAASIALRHRRPVVAGGDNGTTVLATSETYSSTFGTWGADPRAA